MVKKIKSNKISKRYKNRKRYNKSKKKYTKSKKKYTKSRKR